jgi:hypothetical protein
MEFPSPSSKKKERQVPSEKSAREKDLVEGLKCVQKQIQGS